MKFRSEEEVKLIKKQYPEGTKIVVDFMNDPYNPVPSGSIGTVYSVDSMGQIHCEEFGLALIPGEDRFHILKESED